MLKITPGDIILFFGGLVLGLGLVHTYFNFTLTTLAHQGLGPRDTFTGRP
jgi:hypothetical protein